MANMVVGVFSDRHDADKAIDELREEGFEAEDLSVITRSEEDRMANKGADVAEGAVSGATTGGVIGGVAGLLIGLGALTIPGIGALLIGGPLAAALGLSGAAAATASGAVTGALAGGLVGALVNLGIPEEEAHMYEERIKEGGVFIAVPSDDDDEDNVMDILERNGADGVRSITVKE